MAFVKNETDILEQPCWVMLINIVAMDMLKSKIPPGKRNQLPACRLCLSITSPLLSVKNERPVDIRNRPRIPVPDEDPYSVAGDGWLTRKTSQDFIDFFARIRLKWFQRCEREIKG